MSRRPVRGSSPRPRGGEQGGRSAVRGPVLAPTQRPRRVEQPLTGWTSRVDEVRRALGLDHGPIGTATSSTSSPAPGAHSSTSPRVIPARQPLASGGVESTPFHDHEDVASRCPRTARRAGWPAAPRPRRSLGGRAARPRSRRRRWSSARPPRSARCAATAPDHVGRRPARARPAPWRPPGSAARRRARAERAGAAGDGDPQPAHLCRSAPGAAGPRPPPAPLVGPAGAAPARRRGAQPGQVPGQRERPRRRPP